MTTLKYILFILTRKVKITQFQRNKRHVIAIFKKMQIRLIYIPWVNELLSY